jgi:hypothetical protein
VGDDGTHLAYFHGWDPHARQQTSGVQLGQSEGGLVVRFDLGAHDE